VFNVHKQNLNVILLLLFHLSLTFGLAEDHYEVHTSFHISGLYVSRNTYIRAGVAEWKVTNPVHLVYFYSLSYLCDIILFIKFLFL
jgi:hypothetical protein